MYLKCLEFCLAHTGCLIHIWLSECACVCSTGRVSWSIGRGCGRGHGKKSHGLRGGRVGTSRKPRRKPQAAGARGSQRFRCTFVGIWDDSCTYIQVCSSGEGARLGIDMCDSVPWRRVFNVEKSGSWLVRFLFMDMVLLQCTVSLLSFRRRFFLLWESQTLFPSSTCFWYVLFPVYTKKQTKNIVYAIHCT